MSISPRDLLSSDSEGHTPLSIARVFEKEPEIIAFLEEKTEAARLVEENFSDLNDEEFKERFDLVRWK